MLVKVCGIKTKDNFKAISKLPISMIGLNFYKPSPRYVNTDVLDNSILNTTIKKVGVFVNEKASVIKRIALDYKLNYLQLHGNESVEYCKELANILPVIKVFSVNSNFDFNTTKGFEMADYFLFDTKVDSFGGSGKKFDWAILKNYKGTIPFLLAGGISPLDYDAISNINHSQFKGIDINSKFEIAPGIKNSTQIKNFLKNEAL